MARTKRSARLGSRESRIKLAPEKRHQEPLSDGRYLLYRKPENGAAGSWMARWVDKDTRKSVQRRLGDADDLLDADGVNILDFKTAQARAEKVFEELNKAAHLEATGEVLSTGPYTVASAMADYLRDAEKRGVKGLQIMKLSINAHITPELGGISVVKLSTEVFSVER